MTDPQWCQSSKPILIVFNYRPGPAVVEPPVEKAKACVPQSYHYAGGTAQVGKLALVTPCTKKKSCEMITNKNHSAGDKLMPIVAHQTCIHSSTRDSQPVQITPCPVKMTGVTPMKKNKVVKEPTSGAKPLLEFLIGDSPLSKLVKCMDFKRKSRGMRTHSSRFIIRVSSAGAEPDRALAQSFLNSVFQNSESFIQWTLNPDPNALFDQMTFLIQAETNQGLVEVLALAHVKYFFGRGILVRWLAVTGKNILTAQFGGNQDLNGSSWRKRGLSTSLLAIAESIGKSWFGIRTPKMFAEVRADDVEAQAFYKKKGFIRVHQFPSYVEKDLHSQYESHHTQHECTALGKAAETTTEILHALELNHWIGKVGDIKP